MYLLNHLEVYILIYSMLVLEIHTGSHSLKYHFNVVSTKCTNLPLYSIVGIMDNTRIVHYNNEIRKAQLRDGWMDDPEDLQVWENITQLAQKYEEQHQSSLQHIKRMINPSKDLHTYQIQFECVLYDDGSIGGHTEFGYNGRDFIFFDKHQLMYIPATKTAQILTQQWNRDQSKTCAENKFAEQHCVEWISRYSKRVREKMKTKAHLEVKVWGQHQSDDVTRLHCLVYGFHPRPVDVKWVRNGEDVTSDEMSPILPHPDGTYQIRVSVEVPTRDGYNYSCYVDHSSLEETLTVKLDLEDQKMGSLTRTRVSLFAASLFSCLLVICFGFSQTQWRASTSNVLKPILCPCVIIK
ncbi:major histocompatibility complex class I-related gene protein-like [Aquarana catesbeiana]|uniref:major histocompatibility complex class I-related gene protein-like n=1 Tax=Aquarana catesbeiana TaxID=8400 RepID=UPI003CCA195A